MRLNVNGRAFEVDIEPEMPLLWVLRELLGLTGTKYGCGIAQCDSCTMHLDGEPVRSCSLPVSAAAGKRVITIEGLSRDSSHPVQKAWAALDVPQCGYCQSGQIMAAVALLEKNPDPTDKDIDKAMTLGYRHPMGPLRLTDLVGLDVRLAIAEYLHEQLGSEAFRPPAILRELVAAGRLGQKSGRGFYDW